MLAEYASCNFTLGHGGFGTRVHAPVPGDDATLAELGADPFVWGFQGPDEPGASEFPELATTNARIKRLAPSRPFWVNLLPSYGFASLAEYDDYITSFLEVVEPEMFTYDHYCLVGNDPEEHARSWYSPHHKGDYFAHLEIVRQRALEAEVDFGVIVSVGTFAGVRGASEAELRWQAFTTLAYGARALG